ncbi:hypothetical protein BGZ67_002542 [Mortierella alpina]|nr:hypothetical protein BGZ67_002542 [Mortierella alpina]
MLPNLPRLTNLQRLKLRIKHTWMCDVGLFLDALQCLPPSLQELDLQVLDWKQGEFSDTPATSPRAWTTRAIRRFTLNHALCGIEFSFLIPFLRTCPSLECLLLSDVSSNYAEELMGTLASACPQLSWLELDSRDGTECLYFAQLHQKLSALTLDVSNDTTNVVVPAILSHSMVTLRELRLKNASWVPSLDMAMILRTCAELRVFQVDAYSIPTGRSRASITLQDLVEAPWASTHLLIVNLAVTDARDIGMVEDDNEDDDTDENENENLYEDDERKETARLVLLLHQQIQKLKNFSRYSLFSFSGRRFDAMPLQNPLRYLNARMAECDLRILRAMAIGDGIETVPQHAEINTTRET